MPHPWPVWVAFLFYFALYLLNARTLSLALSLNLSLLRLLAWRRAARKNETCSRDEISCCNSHSSPSPPPPLLLPPTLPKLWHFGPIFGLAPSLTAASWSVASFCGCSLLNEIDLCLGCPGLVQLKPDELQNWPSGVYTSTDIKYTQCASHSHRILRIRSVQAIALAAFKLQLMLGYLVSRLLSI